MALSPSKRSPTGAWSIGSSALTARTDGANLPTHEVPSLTVEYEGKPLVLAHSGHCGQCSRRAGISRGTVQ